MLSISLVVLSCLESFIFNQQSIQNSDHKHFQKPYHYKCFYIKQYYGGRQQRSWDW